MDEEIRQAWSQLLESVSVHQGIGSLAVGVQLLLAAALGLYLRGLFRRYSLSASDADAIAKVFPLLIVITTGVIGVVKTSVALSLGFLGALSLVRFRSAIKEPEELVYLFLCVAVGLALGAGVPLVAVVLVAVATLLAVVLHQQARRSPSHSLLLTITGDADDGFVDGDTSVFAAVREVAGSHALQRVDLENGRGQVRVVLRPADSMQTADLIGRLRRRLPDCEFSYVNLDVSL